MTEKEMYLPRPLTLHVKLISLFCMQIHSGHMTRDRLFLCYCSCIGTLNQHLKSFCITEVQHGAADEYGSHKVIVIPVKSEPNNDPVNITSR